MSSKKDIKFTEKKVDDSWKNTIQKEKKVSDSAESSQNTERKQKETVDTKRPSEKETLTFSTFVSSLGMQSLYHMGEIPNPMTEKKEVNLDAAVEIIDILVLLQEKSKGNLTEEEAHLINSLIYDLQITYVKKVKDQ